MPGPDIGLDGGTSVVLEVRGKALPPTVRRVGSTGRSGSVDGEESTSLREGRSQGLGTSNEGLVELRLRSTAKVDVGLVPALELGGVRVGHPVALDIVNDLLEEGAPLGPVAVVSGEGEIVPRRLVCTPKISHLEGEDTVTSPYVARSDKISATHSWPRDQFSLLSPDTLERGHRGAESVVVVVHVNGISTRGRADLSASSCLVVDLEVIEV